MPGPNVARDIRLSGFGDRAPLSTAWTWLEVWSAPSSPEIVPIAEATGRVLAESITASIDLPDLPRAAENGYAVRSSDCDGANAYNPLLLSLLEPGTDGLAPGFACLITSGLALPSGADAVLPFEAAQTASPRSLEVLAPVASGTGIDHASPAANIVLERGRLIGPRDVGCLAAMGVERVAVVCRPRVALVVPGAKSGPDALTPMLRALIARDGALAEPIAVDAPGEAALTTALISGRNQSCALMLIAGRAGTGPDDVAALALQAAGGAMTHHGFALHPGGASGLGVLPGPEKIPVVLLPGEPLACFVAYDIMASRLVRRLVGAKQVSPYRTAEFELARKIVSGIGMVEVVPVRLDGGRALPIGVDDGLAGAIQADGFVMVPDTSEGYLAGRRVRVHLYEPRHPETAREVES
jgi:molybdopterin molybdotransferase